MGYSPWGHKKLDTTELLSTAQDSLRVANLLDRLNGQGSGGRSLAMSEFWQFPR